MHSIAGAHTLHTCTHTNTWEQEEGERKGGGEREIPFKSFRIMENLNLLHFTNV